MPRLSDVVVEGEDGAGEVEGRVDGVGEVGAEGEGVGRGGEGNAVAFGERGGVELFLLGDISFVWVEDITGEGTRRTSIGLDALLSKLQ